MRRLLLLLLIPAFAGPAMAQSTALLTEFGASLLLSSNQPDRRHTLFQYGLGAVRNVSRRIGIGGAILGTWSEGAVSVGVGPRLRYWASPKVSFDLAPGLIVFQGGSRNLGFNAQLAANYGAHLSLATTLQMTDESYRHFRRVEWFAGARLNGKVGTVAGIATPILVFLGYLALYSGSSD